MSREMYFALRKFFHSSLFREANLILPIERIELSFRYPNIMFVHQTHDSSVPYESGENHVSYVYSTDIIRVNNKVSLFIVEGLVKACRGNGVNGELIGINY